MALYFSPWLPPHFSSDQWGAELHLHYKKRGTTSWCPTFAGKVSAGQEGLNPHPAHLQWGKVNQCESGGLFSEKLNIYTHPAIKLYLKNCLLVNRKSLIISKHPGYHGKSLLIPRTRQISLEWEKTIKYANTKKIQMLELTAVTHLLKNWRKKISGKK